MPTIEALQEQFEPFREELLELEARLLEGEDPTTLPDLIDYDDFAGKFRLRSGHVGKIALTNPAEEIIADEYIERKVPALIKGIGYPSLEQIVAYSEANPPAIITEYVDGTPMGEWDNLSLNSISLRTYGQLFAALKTMERLGLGIPDGDYLYKTIADDQLAIVGYEKAEDEDFTHKVLGLARNLTWETSEGTGEPVTDYAMRYFAACYKLLGKEVGMEVIDFWLRKGYALPRADFNIT